MRSSTGVFICQCGGNISDAVDIPSLSKMLKAEGAGLVKDVPHLCSKEGQGLIRECIKEGTIDRVVIAACSPKIHGLTFQDCVGEAGIDPLMMDRANIREQCAWIESGDRTEKAMDMVRSSMLAVQYAVPVQGHRFSSRRVVAVVGGGISGITAAQSLANLGIKTYIIERGPTIGGNMVKIGKVISPEKLAEDCAMCSLSPLMEEASRNKNIEILTDTEVVGLEGRVGDFHLELQRGPRMVDASKCLSCGRCAKVCSATASDEWNEGLSKRKAIYRPFSQSIPPAFTIDVDCCTRCGNCVEACPAGAIDLGKEVERSTISVGAIVIATGHEELDPVDRYDTGYGRYPEVVTQMELARLLAVNGPTNGKLILDGRVPRKVVMVQCVGSREGKPGSIPYCSKICCIVAMKHASYIMKHFPGTEVTICYTDIRAPGTYESYYQESQERGVRFIRGRVGEVIKQQGKVRVRVEDTLGKGILGIEADMVVLSCAIMPSPGTKEIAKTLGVSSTPELFIHESHPKLEPGSTSSRGIFVCGSACGAKDIGESVMQALTTAMKVSELVLREIEIRPEYAVIDSSRCSSCRKCVDLCPSGAIFFNGSISIDPISCTGLGECIPHCPDHAIDLVGSTDEQICARIDGCSVTGEPKVIAFLDREIGYVAADNAGANRLKYPSSIRIIGVPSVLRLEPKHLTYAFEKGAAGVFLGDGTANASENGTRDRVKDHVTWLKAEVAKAGIDPRRISFYEAYLPHYKGMVSRLDAFNTEIAGLGPMRSRTITTSNGNWFKEAILNWKKKWN